MYSLTEILTELVLLWSPCATLFLAFGAKYIERTCSESHNGHLRHARRASKIPYSLTFSGRLPDVSCTLVLSGNHREGGSIPRDVTRLHRKRSFLDRDNRRDLLERDRPSVASGSRSGIRSDGWPLARFTAASEAATFIARSSRLVAASSSNEMARRR